MANVDFSEENFAHCHCPECPVQHGNDCVEQKQSEFPNYNEAEKLPKEVPMLYCSIGKSACSGLKEHLPCICPTCAVWYENRLGKLHFCTKGSSLERERKENGKS